MKRQCFHYLSDLKYILKVIFIKKKELHSHSHYEPKWPDTLCNYLSYVICTIHQA